MDYNELKMDLLRKCEELIDSVLEPIANDTKPVGRVYYKSVDKAEHYKDCIFLNVGAVPNGASYENCLFLKDEDIPSSIFGHGSSVYRCVFVGLPGSKPSNVFNKNSNYLECISVDYTLRAPESASESFFEHRHINEPIELEESLEELSEALNSKKEIEALIETFRHCYSPRV